MGCQSEYEYYEVIPKVSPGEDLDILLVIDTSCSMMDDWSYIQYGLTRTIDDLYYLDINWKLSIITADPNDYRLFELPKSSDIGWEMLSIVKELKAERFELEMGYSAAINMMQLHKNFLRNNTSSLVIFLSDEEEQSSISTEEFKLQWPSKLIPIIITGPNENNYYQSQYGCYAETSTKFHELTNIWIDICTKEPWSITDKIINYEK